MSPFRLTCQKGKMLMTSALPATILLPPFKLTRPPCRPATPLSMTRLHLMLVGFTSTTLESNPLEKKTLTTNLAAKRVPTCCFTEGKGPKWWLGTVKGREVVWLVDVFDTGRFFEYSFSTNRCCFSSVGCPTSINVFWRYPLSTKFPLLPSTLSTFTSTVLKKLSFDVS